MSEVRGLHTMGDYMYSVIDSILYRTDILGNSLKMGGTLSTTSGKVWMKENGTQLMITDGTYGYILSGTTLTQITDADFPTPSSLAYQDGYFIIAKKNSGQFYISGSYDGTAWDALDYATAESYPDYLKAIVSANRELWLIGEKSYEVWYNSGASDLPFDRIAGAVAQIGTIAPHSCCQRQDVVCWLDDQKIVRSSEGYVAKRISTSQIEYQIAALTTASDAFGFMYSQEGHVFYILTFPADSKTFSYDFTTNYWHTRASGESNLRHRANCHTFFNGFNMVGDYDNGKIYKYDLDKFSDDGTILRRIRTAQAAHNDRKNLFHHSFEVDFEGGVGLAVDDAEIGSGSDPQVCLEWSNDGGHTWSNEHWVDMGLIGEYTRRAKWNALGSARDRIYRVTITDPVKTVMIRGHLEASPGVH